MTDMSLGQHGAAAAPSSSLSQTHLHDPGTSPGMPSGGGGGGGVHVGSLADKLRLAASKGQTDKVRDLLQAGATFTPDRDGRTALHYAAQNGYLDTCKLLIEKDCDLDCQDAMGYTALLRASSQGLLDVVRVCLEGGCGVDFADEHGNTALHEAAWHGFSKTLEMLIKYNANVFRTNQSGFTALHLAAQNGHNESSRVLLYGGINADLQNNYGDTALHTAARYGHAGVTRILISARCKLNVQNKNGDTALHISAALKRRKIAKILVESHADVTVQNKQNETATDVARRKEHPEIILIITSLSRPHSAGPRHHEVPGVTFKDDIEMVDGPVVCADDEPPLKPEKQEKERRFFPFFKKKKKEKDKEKDKSAPTTPTQVKRPVPPGKVQPILSKPVPGFFSQYVPRHGNQYYRDLAGNIKQGPIGYSPVCQCGPSFNRMEKSLVQTREQLYDHIDASHQLSSPIQVLRDRIEQLDLRAAQQAHSLDRLTRERLEAERRACQVALDQRLQQERHHTQYVLDSYNEGLQSQVHDWLEDRLASYSHCLDHHHDDLALPSRNLFTDIHLGPDGGRLFRTRSDETLSVSDYSGKGRKKHFYESRKAAMEQIRGWNVPSMKKDSSKRRERGRSADDLGNKDSRAAESVERNNTQGSMRNLRKGVSAGNVTVTTADIHSRPQDRRADGASPQHEGSPAREYTSQQASNIPSGYAGRQTPIQGERVTQKGQYHARFQLRSSQLQTQSRQARSHGNIATQPAGASASGTAAQFSQSQGASQPLRGILRSKTEDSGFHYYAYDSPYRQPNLDERGPLGVSEQSCAPGGHEGPLSYDVGSTGRSGSLPPACNQQHNPLYGTAQSVRDVAQNNSGGLDDLVRFRPRTRSIDGVLDGGDMNGSRYRSRSEDVLDINDGARPRRSPGPKGDYSGYVTDSDVRNAYPEHSSYFPHRQISHERSSGYVTDSNVRSASYERSSVRPVSAERNSVSASAPNKRPMPSEQLFGHMTDSQITPSTNPQSNFSNANVNRGSYRQQDQQTPRLPATRYRVLPPLPPSAQVGDQRCQQTPTARNTTVNSSAGSRSATPAVTSHQGAGSYSPRQAENNIMNNQNYSHGAYPSQTNSVHTQGKDSRHGESPREYSNSSVGYPPRDRLPPPYRSTLGLSDQTRTSTNQTFHGSQSGRTSVSKSESNLAKDPEIAGREQTPVPMPRSNSQHYSSGCLQHDDFSYSAVYNGGSKEDSTCSSNQDSGYSSRMLQGLGFAGGGRSGESGTPSSSFSTDRSISLGPPSNASSPYMHMGGNSFSDYVHMGGSSSDYQRGGYSSDHSGRGSSCPAPQQTGTIPYSEPDHKHHVNKNGAGFSRIPSSSQQPSGPASAMNIQSHVQGWYQRKLLEAAERLRNSEQYSRPENSYSNYATIPIHYDPVHGSDV